MLCDITFRLQPDHIIFIGVYTLHKFFVHYSVAASMYARVFQVGLYEVGKERANILGLGMTVEVAVLLQNIFTSFHS